MRVEIDTIRKTVTVLQPTDFDELSRFMESYKDYKVISKVVHEQPLFNPNKIIGPGTDNWPLSPSVQPTWTIS